MGLVALLVSLGTALWIIGDQVDSLPLRAIGWTLLGINVGLAWRRHRATRHNLPAFWRRFL